MTIGARWLAAAAMIAAAGMGTALAGWLFPSLAGPASALIAVALGLALIAVSRAAAPPEPLVLTDETPLPRVAGLPPALPDLAPPLVAEREQTGGPA